MNLTPMVMGIAGQLDGKEVASRVEPDDELGPLAVDGFGEPVAERRRLDAFRRFEVRRHRGFSLPRASENGRGPRSARPSRETFVPGG